MHCPAQLHSKLPDVGTTIFTVIGDLAAQHQALNLSQGAPNFECDPRLIDRAVKAMREGKNQYAGMTGLPALREAIVEKVRATNGVSYDAEEEVTVVASASQGLYAAIAGLVHPGDEVIYFDPSFDSYAPIVRLQGATPITIPLTNDGFRVPWGAVAQALTPRTRMIIVNTPHNPTATVFSAADLEQLAALTRDTNIIVLSDEVYEHVVFDDGQHYGVARHPQLAARSVVVASFGKSYHVTGWRVGYCLAAAALTAEIRKIHQFMMFAADTPMQYAFADLLADPSTYEGLSAFYQRKRDLLIEGLAGSRFELLPSAGSFFLLARFRQFSDEADRDFVLRLIREHRVATIPLSAFYSDGLDLGIIRLSFSKDEATLIEGARRLRAV
ncbi:MAG: methionine aminotransferase [Pseudomonadota bacterium]